MRNLVSEDTKVLISNRPLKFKTQPTDVFLLSSIKCSVAPPMFRLCCLNCALCSSQKLGGVAKHLIDGSEKCICQLSFEC